MKFCSVVFALVFVAIPAFAQSNIKSAQGKFTFDQASALTSDIQSYLASYHETNEQLLEDSDALISQKSKSLAQTASQQEEIIKTIDSQLSDAILALFAADTKLYILPDIIEINQGLLDMTDYYKQQVYQLNTGPFFQKKRNTLSLMFEQLRQDILNTKSIVIERRKAIEVIRDELLALSKDQNPSLVQLGFDHFINLRLALLENQSLVLSDVSTMQQGFDLENISNAVGNLCHGSNEVGRFLNLIDQNGILMNYTAPWSSLKKVGTENLTEYNVATWRTKRTDENDSSARESLEDIDGMLGGFNGKSPAQFYPGEISGWKSCAGTKQNILVDLKNKIATEITRGNKDSAIAFELLASDLQVDINRMNGRITRLEQFRELYKEIGKIAAEGAYEIETDVPSAGTKLMTDQWKIAVWAQLQNIERLLAVEKDVLLASRKLTNLAKTQLLILASAKNSDERKAKYFPVSSRLDAVIKQGFGRLEEELDSSAASLNVMSLNVKSGESITNEGYLGEAINTYAQIVDVRNNQMEIELSTILPKEKANAQSTVSRIENQRLEAQALRAQVTARQQSLSVLKGQFEQLEQQFEKFFSISRSHPVYTSVVNQFIADTKSSKSVSSELVKGFSGFIIKYSTIGPVSGKSSTRLCGGKSSSACKKVEKSSYGKKVKKIKGNYQKGLTTLVDSKSTVILGQTNLSSLAAAISSVKSALSAL